MNSDYLRIEKAIRYLDAHRAEQPELADVAKHVGLSPAHFQRMFTRWAGISPKRFLQHRTAEVVKRLLRERRSVLDASYEAGLSGSSRLHDLIVNAEAVSPGEYQEGRRRARGPVRISSVAVRRVPHRDHAARDLPSRVRESGLAARRARAAAARLAARGVARRPGGHARSRRPGVPDRRSTGTFRRSRCTSRDELPAEGVGGAAEHPRRRRHDVRRNRRSAPRAGSLARRGHRRSGATP